MTLTTKLGKVVLDNPIIPASGTFGYGYEFSQFYNLNILGSIAIKGITSEMRFGNPLPRIAEIEHGLINSIGLQNPGVDAVIQHELPRLSNVYQKPVIANVGGSTIEEYVAVTRKLSNVASVGIIELNVSCPNVSKGGIQFGTDPNTLKALLVEVRKATTKPLFVKLSPNVTDIVLMAKIVEETGCDGVVLVNTLVGMRLNLKTAKPIIANRFGGVSGPAIFPIALKMVYQVYEVINIPIIGVGGIQSADDVIEMMMCGARAVQIGSANLINPYVCQEIVEELPKRLEELGYQTIEEIIGVAHNEK